jgi:hypothetical protein
MDGRRLALLVVAAVAAPCLAAAALQTCYVDFPVPSGTAATVISDMTWTGPNGSPVFVIYDGINADSTPNLISANATVSGAVRLTFPARARAARSRGRGGLGARLSARTRAGVGPCRLGGQPSGPLSMRARRDATPPHAAGPLPAWGGRADTRGFVTLPPCIAPQSTAPATSRRRTRSPARTQRPGPPPSRPPSLTAAAVSGGGPVGGRGRGRGRPPSPEPRLGRARGSHENLVATADARGAEGASGGECSRARVPLRWSRPHALARLSVRSPAAPPPHRRPRRPSVPRCTPRSGVWRRERDVQP